MVVILFQPEIRKALEQVGRSKVGQSLASAVGARDNEAENAETRKPDLAVVESQPQRFLRNLGAHSVILDVLCQDSSGDYFNIEVQKKNDDDHQKRVRFNRSNIDTAFVESGIK